MTKISESILLEDTTLSWLESLGYQVLHGPDIAPGEPFVERESYCKAIPEYIMLNTEVAGLMTGTG